MKCLTLILLLLAICKVQGGCKFHSAEWLKPTEGPKVAQLSRDDPTKVSVDWSGQLDDQRCIDNYTIYYWRNVDKPVNTKLVRVRGPVSLDTNSFTVQGLEACVEYNFQVEFEQNGVFTSRIKKAKGGISRFSTQSFAKLKPMKKV